MIREEHGIQCMPCSSQIISEILPEIQTMQISDFFKPMIYFFFQTYDLFFQTYDLFDLFYCHLTYDSRGAWHTVYAMLLSN